MDDEALGKPRVKMLLVYALFAVAVVTLVLAGNSDAARGEDVQQAPPLQVIVDAVLIDARCHDIPVNFGTLMRYGEEHGIATIDILPLGAQRKSFEVALKQRSESMPLDVLCTSLAAQERELIPGVLKLP